MSDEAEMNAFAFLALLACLGARFPTQNQEVPPRTFFFIWEWREGDEGTKKLTPVGLYSEGEVWNCSDLHTVDTDRPHAWYGGGKVWEDRRWDGPGCEYPPDGYYDDGLFWIGQRFDKLGYAYPPSGSFVDGKVWIGDQHDTQGNERLPGYCSELTDAAGAGACLALHLYRLNKKRRDEQRVIDERRQHEEEEEEERQRREEEDRQQREADDDDDGDD